MMTNVVCRFLNSICIPEVLQMFYVKLARDLRCLPSLNDFTKYIGSQVIGGESRCENFVATTSVKLFENFVRFGMSRNMVTHFWQTVRDGMFESYHIKKLRLPKSWRAIAYPGDNEAAQKASADDSSRDSNETREGAEEEEVIIDYMEHLPKIEAPITFFLST
mmetsp:Transcript_28220/g.42710  ORF Transcript_28220/g.42710 Transcript_28220/m.42710 type:complete len:163 (+) Transcript_28220:910-1398(+)